MRITRLLATALIFSIFALVLFGLTIGMDLALQATGETRTVLAVTFAISCPLLLFSTTDRETKRRVGQRLIARLPTNNLVSLAALIAGSSRPGLRDEWTAHLAGDSGHDPASWEKIRPVLGLVAAAVKCRAMDAAEAAWVPVEAVLRSRTLSNLLVLGISAAATVDVDLNEGRLGVVVSAESLIGIGGMVYGLIRVGRWYRDVKPPEPKARHAKNDNSS